MQERKALTLYELNSMVREVIESTFDRAYWVEAELSEARESKGHCYMELVQKDLFAPTPVARASAKCWRSTWQRLRPKFEAITGQPLHAGMQVMLLVTANFHEAYGFSWIVEDIDPLYTMGDMARKRQEIIQQLKAEGVFDLQKELSLPMFAQRIAVVSSEGAAGYGDFCHQLEDNEYGFKFQAQLFPAVMQGERVESTVIAALNDINAHAEAFDAVVIIRGGGATADMSGFDTLQLAENVANFPLPIITGIGHDRDESVLDMVSFARVKTPTAAAAYLIDNLVKVWSLISDCQDSIIAQVSHRMDMEQVRLSHLAERIPTLFSIVKERQEHRLASLSARMTTLMREHLLKERYRVASLLAAVKPAIERRMARERSSLEQMEIRLKGVDPELLLKRGYSITTLNGKALRDASRLKAGDEIETRLARGRVKSKVETIVNS